MNPCSEENRTRMYQPRQSVRTPLDYDEQFERQSPPEVRVELESRLPAISRQPLRLPETEEEIQETISWLKGQGYLSTPSPVQPPPVIQPPNPPAAERSPRRGLGLIWLALGGCFLWALLHNQPSQPSPSRVASRSGPAWAPFGQSAPPIEVRRALPIDVRRAISVVPRARLVSPAETQTGQWHTVTLPDGSVVQACYQGNLANSADLPPQGRFLGEEWSTGTRSNGSDWIWLQPAGAHFASWVDP
jgi:hypothetical protein